MTAHIEILHARVKEIRARAATQRWEMRQLGHAAGAWRRLERLFALSNRAWMLSERDVATLRERGREPEAVGLAFEPTRAIFIVQMHDIETLEDAKEIALRTSPELLLAPALALVLFDLTSGPPSPPPSPPPRS